MPENLLAAEKTLLANVGMAIRAARLNLGLSQEDLAAKAGISVVYLSDIERGKRNVSIISLIRITTALHLPLSSYLQNLSDNH